MKNAKQDFGKREAARRFKLALKGAFDAKPTSHDAVSSTEQNVKPRGGKRAKLVTGK